MTLPERISAVRNVFRQHDPHSVFALGHPLPIQNGPVAQRAMSDQEPSRETLQALPPVEIARKIERVSVARAKMGIVRTLVLAVLAGSFIAFGGVLTGTIAVGSELGTGPTRLLMGLGFTVGLFMVVITGAELFTGNSLMTVSFFSRKLGVWALARNWTLVYIGNLIGALIVVLLI